MASADGLKVRTERRGSVHILTVTGDLDVGSGDGFTAALEQAAADGPTRIVVDLSGVRSIDAAGARALAAATAASASADPAAGRCRVVLRSLRPALRQVVAAVSPDFDLARSGLVMAHADAAGAAEPGSPTWTLGRESRKARSLAQHTVSGTRRAAAMLAATEDEIADTFLRLVPWRPGAKERLVALSRLAREHAEQLRGLTGNSAVRQAGMLTATADRSGIAAGTLQRAIAFINENARDDISAADIAAAANVTTRAVQLAFRRYLSITPLGYLRQVRLEQAHRELLAAPPAPGTVTKIAADWQFSNLSRFTSRYRDAYGVLPSQTLHQSTSVEARRSGWRLKPTM